MQSGCTPGWVLQFIDCQARPLPRSAHVTLRGEEIANHGDGDMTIRDITMSADAYLEWNYLPAVSCLTRAWTL